MDALSALLAIKVLTFNAAGIPLVHADVSGRMQTAGRAVADGGYDIVGLQELWFDKDSAAFTRAAGLPHAARAERRFAFRSGLTILSRWPIIRKEERAFSTVRPSLRHFFQGETIPSKGLLFARIATPWGEVDAYDAHTLADYRESKYRLLRMTELFELAEGVRAMSAGRPFVILGDLNSGHGDPDFELFLDLLGLVDPCAPAGVEKCGDPRRPKRIDHVLIPGRLDAKARLALDHSMSDHSGFAVDLPRAFMSLRAKPDPKRREAALRAVEEQMAAAIGRLGSRKRDSAWIPFYGAFLAARYDLQAARFAAIRERALTARGRN